MLRPGMLLLLLALQVAQSGWAHEGPLRVLLSNDDGYDAAGLVAVREALQAAGYAVTVVAPLSQQSGSGVRITLGEIAIAQHGHDTWSVDGSPADSTSYAISTLLAARLPDIVVSGANLGQNLGANVVSSGTVGAAVMAVQLGVPAIAVSVGLDLAEARATPTRFPSTVAAYPLAGQIVARLIGRLAAHADGGPLLPPDTLLNLNVPARSREALAGVRLAPLGRHGGFRMIYGKKPGEPRLISGIEIDAAGLTDGERDTALFAQGYATLSLLRPDWNAATEASARVAPLLGELERLRAP